MTVRSRNGQAVQPHRTITDHPNAAIEMLEIAAAGATTNIRPCGDWSNEGVHPIAR